MSKFRFLAIAGAVLLATPLGVSTAAQAVSLDAQVYVVHGIPGADLGQANALPVDIDVAGACVETDLQFGQTADLGMVAPGLVNVKVLTSDGSCTGALLLEKMIDFSALETAIVVAHLDANIQAELTKFTADSTPLNGNARFYVIHGAAAPEVDVAVRPSGGSFRDRVVLRNLRNGDQSFTLDVPAGDYDARVRDSSGIFPGSVVFGASGVTLPGDTVSIAFAVGSTSRGSFTVVVIPLIPII